MKNMETAKILVVDDEIFSLQGMSRMMRKAGYNTFEANNGSDCLRLATEYRPDLILLDVVMPDIDGREVCRLIKSNPETKDVYVVLLSGVKTESDSQAEGLEHGADGYIVKPIPNRELLARVKAMLRLKFAESRLAEALEFNNKILATSSVGIATFASDGRITFANEAMPGIIGGTKEQILAENFRVIDSWKVSGLLDAAELVLSTGGKQRREVHIVTSFGKDVWLDCHLDRFTSGEEFHLLVTINDITAIKLAEQEKEKLIGELQEALSKVKTLSGFIPICASCKKIRNDKGYWEQIENYIRDRSQAEFSHSICPDCARKLYPEFYKDK